MMSAVKSSSELACDVIVEASAADRSNARNVACLTPNGAAAILAPATRMSNRETGARGLCRMHESVLPVHQPRAA